MTEQQHTAADLIRNNQRKIVEQIKKAKKAFNGFKLDDANARTVLRVHVRSDSNDSFDVDESIMSSELFLGAYIETLEDKLQRLQQQYKSI